MCIEHPCSHACTYAYEYILQVSDSFNRIRGTSICFKIGETCFKWLADMVIVMSVLDTSIFGY